MTLVTGKLPRILQDPLDALVDRARAVAERSLATEIDEDVVAELENEARGIAHGLHRAGYSPDAHAEDEHRRRRDDDERQFERECDNAEAFALSRVEERGDAVATLPQPGAEPTPSSVAAFSAAMVIAVALGVTFHDRFLADTMDWLLRWIFAMSLGALPGVLVVAFMIGTWQSGRRTAANWVGLAAGIIVGIGGFLIRVSDVATSDTWLVASGLTLIELSAVLFLEVHATRVRADYAAWSELVDQRTRATQLLQQAETDHTERLRRLDSVRKRRAEYLEYLEQRRVLAMPLERLQEILVSSIRPAYVDGIAQNRSIRVGGPLRRVL